MKKSIAVTTALGVLMTSTPALAVPVEEVKQTVDQKGIEEKSVSEQIYLSDLEYIKAQSNVGYGSIQVNKNIDGGTIALMVDGERTEFLKGMGAHATSNLVYDISQYSSEYTRLVSYIGVDASMGSNGDGVKFTIYTSENGTDWKEVKKTGVLKGSNESIYVDIELNGAKFVKLHADKNGGNGQDHAVYGDLKLVKDDYSISANPVIGLQRVEEYDAILSSKTIEENMENHQMTILRRAFVDRIGYESLQRIAGKDVKYADAINYLMNDETALNYFITGGKVNVNGSFARSIKEFCEVYSKYEHELKDPSDNHFNLRLAISTSLSYAYPILNRFWMLSNTEFGAVLRYETYQAMVESGKMDEGGATDGYGKWSTQQFKDLPVTLMRWVVDNRINDDEVEWLADYALSEKAKGKDYLSAYNYITYTYGYDYANPELYKEENKDAYNAKYGNFLNYFDDYGTTGVYRLWMIFEEGSVCGGLAKTYSNLADAFGRPASVVSQPAHAATIIWAWVKENNRYEWIIQNNISGWSQSGNEYNDRLLNWGNQSWSKSYSASYNVLATDVLLDYDDYVEATLLNLLADSYKDNDTKEETYLKALEVQPLNLDAMEGLINCYKADDTKTSTDYLELAKKIVSTYTYYPQTMMELLALIEGGITNEGEKAQLDVLKNNALLKASKATADVSTNVTMSKQLASHYLSNGEITELATFSFSGEKANTIVLNSKYEGTGIRVKYSLDSGKTWTESDKHEIKLSKDELAKITAENDIIVGLVGASDDFNHTIDILEGKSLSLQLNDYENLLLGDVANLEFKLDGSDEWCDYVTGNEESINTSNVTGIRFEGNQTIKARYKANGVYLQSAEVTYTFNANTDTDNKKYVQLKNVKVLDASPHQSGRQPETFINGIHADGYHTVFNTTTKDKFFAVEFDKPRYINSIDYIFNGGNNGRLKSGEIQVSMDGQEWTTVKTFSNNPRDKYSVTFNFDTVVKAKYLKIVATETHGNHSYETNMYLSGSDLRFYEDTTIVKDETPEQPPVEDEEGDVPPSEDIPNVDTENVPSPPNYDVEDDMEVDTENLPSKPNYDVEDDMEVDTEKLPSSPNYDVEDDMEVDTENLPSKPNYDVEDDMEVDTENLPSKPNYDVEDDMEVNPDTDQTVDDKPTILPDDFEVDTNKPEEDENGDTTPPTVAPQPPVSDGETVQPPVENVPTNGIENLKDLDKELQEKVDSLIAEVVVAEGSLSLNITGDNEDIAHVEGIEITEEGIFAVVDGEKLKFEVALDGLELDLTDARAVRVNGSNHATVPHQNTEDGLKVSSSNFQNILITSKVSEPFVDVNDSDWFKEDIEEAYNYVFTTGTTATTYSPYNDITRAQFAVMIARALELKPASQDIELKDLEGQWYQNEAQALYEAGIITGYQDGTFGGGKKITRQQAMTMLGRMLEYTGVDTKVEEDVKFADMDKIGEYALQSVKYLASQGVVVSGENTKFNPYNNLTRAQMAKMLVRSLRLTDLY